LTATTTNATETEMTTDGLTPSGVTNRISIPTASLSAFDIMIAAKRIDSINEAAFYNIKVSLYRDTSPASTTIFGQDYKTAIAESNEGWEPNVYANTTDGALNLSVTGEAGKTIKWVAFVRQLVAKP
jgi:hypothetical protein